MYFESSYSRIGSILINRHCERKVLYTNDKLELRYKRDFSINLIDGGTQIFPDKKRGVRNAVISMRYEFQNLMVGVHSHVRFGAVGPEPS